MPDETIASFISIVLPTFNRAKLIKETIESIQKQTYTGWELIIIDDGSSDNTSEIVHQINDPRIRYYQLGHLGMEHARKNGLQKAKGQFIGFMDSDDLWAPTKLEKQLSCFAENMRMAFCLTGGYEFETPGEPVNFYYKQRTGTSKGPLFIPFFQSRVVAATPSLLFKRECLDTVSFRQETQLADTHFILSLAMHFEGVILYEPLLYRRLHPSNFSTVNCSDLHYIGIDLLKCYERFLPREVFTNALLKTHIQHGENCLKRKKKIEAITEFMQAWKYQPFNIVPIKKMAKAILS